MEVLQWIAKYWIEWLCGLVTGGVVLFAKHYIKIQKQVAEDKWKEKEKTMCSKIIANFDEKISKVETQSQEGDNKLHKELDQIHREVDSMESGILSIQGKQFRDNCERLLQHGHYVTVDEYEEFETEYEVYKGLGGNHRGDALHDRVVDKVQAQVRSENRNFEDE